MKTAYFSKDYTMNALVEYITSHPDWRKELVEKPYCLTIKDKGPYTIFSYSQIDSDFYNPVVQVSRGIILKIIEKLNFDNLLDMFDVKIVCWAFNKFGNYSEGYADKIDWSSAQVLEKVDGSIIKVWHDDDLWHISTNGMIDAFATDLMNPTDEYKSFGDLFIAGAKNTCGSYSDLLDRLDPDHTYIFELVGPWNRVVVPYKEIAIYHIGTRNNLTEQELIEDIGVQKPAVYNFGTFEEAIANAAALPFSQEGYVVVDKYWKRVKVKSSEYVACHRLRGEIFTVKRAIDLALLNEQSEFLTYFPEYQPAVDRVVGALNKIREFLAQQVEKLSHQTFVTQKDYALMVKDWEFSGYFFGIRSGKIRSINDYLKTLDYSVIEKWMQ